MSSIATARHAFVPWLVALVLLVGIPAVFSEPIVISGQVSQSLVGADISAIRVLDGRDLAIPFQIDELASDGSFVCDRGKKPNADAGNGVLDGRDEVAFLWEDCTPLFGDKPPKSEEYGGVTLVISHKDQKRWARIVVSDAIPLSKISYVTYDSSEEMLRTHYYYAQFAKNRFHFVHAGIRATKDDDYLDLTNGLRVDIRMKMLWGLIPIHYSEDNLVCVVERYKVGPIRLIRRGDFHLNVGLGMKGSKAFVNQICYPQVVGVPVSVHVPIRFRTFFSEAYLEMAPAIRKTSSSFSFRVPDYNLTFDLAGGKGRVDTLVLRIPDHHFFQIDDGEKGFGWLLETTMDRTFLKGSGYVFCKPSKRDGFADCGFRIGLRDLPAGRYDIANWVVFSKEGIEDLALQGQYIGAPALIRVQESGTTFRNLLGLSGKEQP